MNIFWQGLNELAIILIIVSIILSISYFIKLKSEKISLRISLSSLRFLSLLLLSILISHPIIKWNSLIPLDTNLNLIVDNSKSMKSHSLFIGELINDFKTFSKNNSIDFNLISIENIELNNKLNFENTKTDFTKIPVIINQSINNHYILISDGNINSGLDFNSVSKLLNSPLHIIGIGDEKNNNDIAISNKSFPKYHIKTDKFILKYSLYSQLDSAIIVTSILKNESGIIKKENISLPKGSSSKDLIFELEGEKLKNKNILTISSSIKELNNNNNKANINVVILDENRNISFISGGLSANTTFIKKLINEIPLVIVNHSFRTGNRWHNKWSEKGLFNSKLIIIEGFPINSNDVEIFKNIVKNNIPIVYISSPYENAITSREMVNLFSIESKVSKKNTTYSLINNSEFFNVNEYPTQLLNKNWVYKDNIIDYSDESSAITKIENNLFIFIPEIFNLNLKLEKSKIKNLIKEYLINFISNSINLDTELISVATQKESMYLGEENSVELSINNIDNIDFIESGLKLETNKIKDYILFKNKNNLNEFIYNPFEVGETKIWGYLISSNFDTVWSKPLHISVLKLSNEKMNTSLNEMNLRYLSKNSNGTYHHFKDYSQLLGKLPIKKITKNISKMASPIDLQKYWILIGIFLLIEWALRKRNGLL